MLLHLPHWCCILIEEIPMAINEPNQATRHAVELSTEIIPTGIVQSVVLIIGVGVTGPA
jgi:hypothetical protein